MHYSKQSELIAKLESLIDSATLFDVTIALALVCAEKAEHIETTWQDKATAKPWIKSEREITKAARTIAILSI